MPARLLSIMNAVSHKLIVTSKERLVYYYYWFGNKDRSAADHFFSAELTFEKF